MKAKIFITALIIAVSINGCGKAEDAIELMRQISQLEKEKKALEEKLSQADEIIEQVRQENSVLKNGIEQMRQENSVLKNDLVTLRDKDKKNLDTLFR